MEPTPQPERFLRISELTKQIGLCRSSVYNFIQTQDFPKPVKIGSRSSRWRASEVDAWMDRQVTPKGKPAPQAKQR